MLVVVYNRSRTSGGQFPKLEQWREREVVRSSLGSPCAMRCNVIDDDWVNKIKSGMGRGRVREDCGLWSVDCGFWSNGRMVLWSSGFKRQTRVPFWDYYGGGPAMALPCNAPAGSRGPAVVVVVVVVRVAACGRGAVGRA